MRTLTLLFLTLCFFSFGSALILHEEESNQTHEFGFQSAPQYHYNATIECLAYLNSFIGNRNGQLIFGSKSFSTLCRDIDLSEAFSALALRATCQRTDHPDQYRQTLVTIKNFGPCVPPKHE